ncbi:MAG TPA: 16S rRNA (uracil(1498)-N(3))-methyltransferase [Firmicutes bacterium]|nr:16S rRNA (uracil(1498)-N(3))-methyltransferase [Bacillota bacterium]
MHRFITAPEMVKRDADGRAEQLLIVGEELAHLSRVLRLSPGEAIQVIDGSGWQYDAVLQEVTPEVAVAAVTGASFGRGEMKARLHLFQALPKGDKMDYIVQKATELGAAAIIPVSSVRSIPIITGDRARRRVERWQRIAREAAKQCGRTIWPVVQAPAPLVEAVRESGLPHIILAWEEATKPLAAAVEAVKAATIKVEAKMPAELTSLSPSATPSSPAGTGPAIGVVVGPEGGLDAAEVAELAAGGAVTVSLGPRLLRTETAGPALLAAISYGLGELG